MGFSRPRTCLVGFGLLASLTGCGERPMGAAVSTIRRVANGGIVSNDVVLASGGVLVLSAPREPGTIVPTPTRTPRPPEAGTAPVTPVPTEISPTAVPIPPTLTPTATAIPPTATPTTVPP